MGLNLTLHDAAAKKSVCPLSKGNDIRLLWTPEVSPAVSSDGKITFSAPLVESEWRRASDNLPSSREHLMMALAGVDALLVRADVEGSIAR